MACIFCDIAAGKAPCHKIWEDEHYLAFLSIFPNTEGFTVVIPKVHYPSYAFDLADDVLTGLVLATKKVAKVLEKAFPDVARCGMFFEGYGVDHIHSKLSPMHGTADMTEWRPIEHKQPAFYTQYPGFLSSHDCERADDKKLAELAATIRASQEK
ncbi:HIT family protein [Morganella morganii]|uniref:HIT family protein n=1 Tax=Morganella morganii TaxID=582 RepID=UPI00164CA0E8|nr:HIT family protein [Morganella morganii]MBC4011703.1 HIT family protein [Morganella morganii]